MDLLSKLVEIDTDSMEKKNYEAIVEVIRGEAEDLGLETSIHDGAGEAGDSRPRPNILVELDGGLDRTLIIAAHYDTVPPGDGWSYPPHKLTLIGDEAYGRGAADDKSSIAAALGALRLLSERGSSKMNILLAATCDEEVGGEAGLGYLARKGVITGDYGLVLDASPDAVYAGACGIVWGKIIVEGVQGHAAYPHEALNPIDEAVKAFTSLRRFSRERERIYSRLSAPPNSPHRKVWGRFTLTMLNAGWKENVIPRVCEARFDMRICPDEDPQEAIDKLNSFIGALKPRIKAEISCEVDKVWPPYYTDPSHVFIEAFRRAASKAAKHRLGIAGELVANDGRWLAGLGIPTISFGALRKCTHIHGVDEHVHVSDLILVRDSIVNLAEEGVPRDA
ncbi:MAG: M20/M25/M40 family metallo-hydrolase [Candidatus Bathyarchaeia archaeon]